MGASRFLLGLVEPELFVYLSEFETMIGFVYFICVKDAKTKLTAGPIAPDSVRHQKLD